MKLGAFRKFKVNHLEGYIADAETITLLLNDHRFNEKFAPQDVTKHFGWVVNHDICVENITEDAVFDDTRDMALLTLRIDTKSISKEVLKSKVKKRAKELEDEGIKVTKLKMAEINDALSRQLLKEAKPRSASLRALWDIPDKSVYVQSSSNSAVDTLTEQFRKTFNMHLKRCSLRDDLETTDKETSDNTRIEAQLIKAFCYYLVFNCVETQFAAELNGMTLELDSRIDFEKDRGDKKAIFISSDLDERELIKFMFNDYDIKQLGFCLNTKQNHQVYFIFDPFLLSFKTVEFNGFNWDDEETIFTKCNHTQDVYKSLFNIITKLFTRFVLLKNDQTAYQRYTERLQDWFTIIQ
jgi:hypothetical protein